MISTYLQPCGIATYTENLAAALIAEGHDVLIAAERTDDERDDTQSDLSAAKVARCWHRHNPNTGELRAVLQMWRPDVVHVQHEFGLWPDRSAFIRAIKIIERSCPLFVTPHTICGPEHASLAWIWRQLSRNGARLVVHTDEGLAMLRDVWQYPADMMTRIDHGSLDPAVVAWADRDESREALGLPEDPVVLLSLGFIGEGKRQHATIAALGELVSTGMIDRDEVRFAIVGKPGGGWQHSGEYVAKIKRWIDALGFEDLVDLRTEFVPATDLPTWFAAADCAINLSIPTPLSASGRLRLAASYGCPQIVEAAGLHADMIEAGAVVGVAQRDSAALRDAILEMVRGPEHRQRYARAGATYASATKWATIAGQHIDWYRGKRRINAI